jgi:D-threo-aldose 1-dehydrogenase
VTLHPAPLARPELTLDLPVLGFGAAAIGNLYAAVEEGVAARAVEAALAAGVDYFDTAPHYGFGLSERRLGAVLPATARISTKVGRRLVPVSEALSRGERHGFVDAEPFEPHFDYSYGGVMASFEASLERLNRDRIDLLMAHDLGRETHGDEHPYRLKEFVEGGYRALTVLKSEGRIGAIGLGVNEWQAAVAVLDHVDLDVVLLAGRYTLLEQTALDSFLPLCARRGVRVIVGGPFNSGALVERPDASRPLHYNYAPASQEICTRVAALQSVCDDHGVPLPAAALQFPMAHAQVASVIPGLADPGQVDDAVRWRDTILPAALWRDLRMAGLLHPDAPTPDERPHP